MKKDTIVSISAFVSSVSGLIFAVMSTNAESKDEQLAWLCALIFSVCTTLLLKYIEKHLED